MGWIANRVRSWATNSQKSEMVAFVEGLRAADSSEVGPILAIATHCRHDLFDNFGWQLLDPIVAEQLHPAITIELGSLIRQHQKARSTIYASGLMVWLFSVRAANIIELRQVGRDMWGQLERGLPFVHQATADLFRATGFALTIDGCEEIPLGLTPEPL